MAQTGDGAIGFKAYVGVFIFLAVTYLFLMPLFIISVIILCIIITYKVLHFFWYHHAPPGKRMRHGMLKGHLSQQYGTKEGTKIYHEIVKGLRKEGYR